MNSHQRDRFFKSSLMQQLMDENKMMPISESWWERELAEKREILTEFWNERIIKLNQKSVDGFKSFVINTHFPRDSAWQEKMDALFSDAVSGGIGLDTFFNALKYLPLTHIRGMGNAENLVKSAPVERKDVKPDVELKDLVNIKRYMAEKGMTAAISLGSAEGELLTSNFSEAKPSSYAMHSVGKVFTGMLALIMVRKGIISEDDLNMPTVKLSEAVRAALPQVVTAQLEKVSLYQLMTHKAGLGDYLGGYCTAIAGGDIPTMRAAEDFLRFAEDKVFPINETRYSNLGILLVGLAVKHAYEKKHGPCDYNEILQRYIINEVGMPSFTPWRPENAKFNSADPVAPHIAGSPAGGYWITAEDLAKFGQWIYKQTKADPGLEILMQKYGQEFYHAEDRVVAHSGGIPSSSAFLSVSLKTGAVVATLSDQPNMAFELNLMVHENILSKQPGIDEEEEVDFSPKKKI